MSERDLLEKIYPGVPWYQDKRGWWSTPQPLGALGPRWIAEVNAWLIHQHLSPRRRKPRIKIDRQLIMEMIAAVLWLKPLYIEHCAKARPWTSNSPPPPARYIWDEAPEPISDGGPNNAFGMERYVHHPSLIVPRRVKDELRAFYRINRAPGPHAIHGLRPWRTPEEAK